jgi:hypothetical protein
LFWILDSDYVLFQFRSSDHTVPQERRILFWSNNNRSPMSCGHVMRHEKWEVCGWWEKVW